MKKMTSQGFAMPAILILISLVAITTYGVLSIAGTSVNQSYTNSYNYTTETAANAGINYAKTQLDDSYCLGYSGTKETDLVKNDNYRLSFQVEVLNDDQTNFSKTVKSTSRFYLPANSANPKYISTKTKTIYSALSSRCKEPGFYGPLVWLDASDSKTVVKNSDITTIESATEFDKTKSFGNVIEERADNGATSPNSWSNSFVSLHNCLPASFDHKTCSRESTKRTNVGLIFQNISVPKNATVANATIKLQCSKVPMSEGKVTHKIRGFYESTNNLSPAPFSNNASNQLKFKLENNELLTQASASYSENSCQPDGILNIDVKDIVQEIINNTNWTTAPNNSIGIVISYQDGNGSRNINKSDNTLTVSYSSGALQESGDNEAIASWIDKSGNGNTAKNAVSSAPLVKGSINGKKTLEFNNSVMSIDLKQTLENKNNMTVFAVIKPSFASSTKDGRIVSATKKSAEPENPNPSIIPLYRNEDKTGFSAQFSSSLSEGLTYDCLGCGDVPNILATVFNQSGSKNIKSSLFVNNKLEDFKTQTQASNQKLAYNVDVFSLGGILNNENPGAGDLYFNGQYAEIIIYDKALNCRQINTINNYLREKWDISKDVYQDSCEETVFTLN